MVLVLDESLSRVGIGDGMTFGVFKDFLAKVVSSCQVACKFGSLELPICKLDLVLKFGDDD